MHALLLASLLGGQSADLATTLARLHDHSAYREGNPFLPQSLPALAAVKIAAVGGVVALGEALRRRHHPRAAAVLYAVGAATGVAAAVRNARLPAPEAAR